MVQLSDLADSLDSQNQASQEAQQEAQEAQAAQEANQRIIDAINQAVTAIVAAEKEHETVSVDNLKDFPTSIKTPDVKEVVKALESLKQPLQENKPDDTKVVEALNRLNDAIAKLPTEYPEAPEPVETVTVKNQPDYKPDFKDLGKAIKSIDVKPVVNIPEEKPDDYTPITDALNKVLAAIKANKPQESPEPDLSPVTQAVENVRASIEALRFPVPNYVLPFRDYVGKASQAQLDANGAIPTSSSPIAVQLDTSTDPILYIGKAPIGSATSASVWQIAKLDTTTGLIKKWADGNPNYDNVYDNRSSLTYS